MQFPGCNFPKLNIKTLKRNKQNGSYSRLQSIHRQYYEYFKEQSISETVLQNPAVSENKQMLQAGPQAVQTTAQQDKHNNTPAAAQEYA